MRRALSPAGVHCLALIGDKGFDAAWLRERLRASDMEAVIPLRDGTSGAKYDREKNKWRRLSATAISSRSDTVTIPNTRHSCATGRSWP